MKIGILTLPLHTNYGGILQAYALQTVLERMGHEVEVIDRKRLFKLPLIKNLLAISKRILFRYVLHYDVKYLLPNKQIEADYLESVKNIRPFIQSHIQLHEITQVEDICTIGYDAIVIGSDQIWRDSYWNYCFETPITNAFLACAKGLPLKRIAYAVSFGIDKWQWDDQTTSELIPLAQLFDALSFREDTGVRLCKEHLGLDSTHVLDPTMLLNKEDYDLLIGDSQSSHEGCCLSYLLDITPEKKQLLQYVSQQMGVAVHYANSFTEYGEKRKQPKILPSVETWLQGFHDAAFVVTDSFHACAFCLIYNKPFVVVGNKKRGMARFQSLLHITSQEHRLIIAPKQFNLTDEFFRCPNCDLNSLRKVSMTFLIRNLS